MERLTLRFLGIVLLCTLFIPVAEAYWRTDPNMKRLNRRNIARDIANVDLYRTETTDGNTTHRSYTKHLRDARMKMILEGLRERRHLYRGEEIPLTEEEEQEQEDRYLEQRNVIPASRSVQQKRATGSKYRGGTVKSSKKIFEACKHLSRSRLARCRYEEQKKKDEMGS